MTSRCILKKFKAGAWASASVQMILNSDCGMRGGWLILAESTN